MNTLHYGDNLDVLRGHVGDESVDLIYLDPPFNSNATYNILFAPPKALRTAADAQHAQIQAFEDSWHWNDRAEDAFDQVARSGNTRAFELLDAMRRFLGENDMMAYLAMMAVRLIELHRVLKPTGSLYLHCDPTASHYLKLLLDGVFGATGFQSEIIWRRTTARESQRRWPRLHDVILHYARDPACMTFTAQRVAIHRDWLNREYRKSDDAGRYVLSDLTGAGTRNGLSGAVWRDIDPAQIGAGRHWRQTPDKLDALDAAGLVHWPARGRYPKLKRYLTPESGTSVGDLWMDIPVLGRTATERLGYPTQKPLALLERIVTASSNEGDVVLDPFCGCGTAIHAAQKLGRRWIGIDVTHLAVSLIERRLQAAFPGIAFKVEGTPRDLASALDLARRDKYQFQWWAVSMVGAVPFGGKRKGADGGIDGILYVRPDGRRPERALVSVKGGTNVGVGMIRDLHSAMVREKAPLAVFITAALPTAAMEREAAAVGRLHAEATGRSYARLQILTLAEMFAGKRPDLPLVDSDAAFRRATREETGRQASLL
jgi:DNA modification methylase